MGEQRDPGRTRRSMLRLAGAAAVGGVASALVARPVVATTGAMQYGASNNAGGSPTSLDSTAAYTLSVTNTGNPYSTALYAVAHGTCQAVVGRIIDAAGNGFGVWGQSNSAHGYPLVGSGGQAQLFLDPSTAAGPSLTAVVHAKGEIAFDAATSALWACTGGGTPGTWRKIAGFGTAGTLHPISPARVYDSRLAVGVIATGASRTVSVANKIDGTGAVAQANVVPAGATAVAFNVTVTNTVGTNGFLAVNDGGNTSAASSTINWFANGQKLANGSIVKLNGSREITVVCGGLPGSTHFIVDVVGYYL